MEIKTLEVNGQEVKVISSRQIAESTGKEHKHVLRDIEAMCQQAEVAILQSPYLDSVRNQDFVVISGKYKYKPNPYQTINAKEFLLNDIAAETLALGYDVKRRVAMLKLIKQLKEKVEAVAALPNFNNPVEAARAWANEVEQKQLKEAENKVLEAANADHIQKHEENAPKVHFAEKVIQNDDDINVGDMAKLLGLGKNKFFLMLREDRILCKSGSAYNTPYQRFIESGYFKVVLTMYKRGGNTEEQTTARKTVVTPKGQIYLTKKYGKNQ